MSKADPYNDDCIYHMAHLVNRKGGVSAKCYKRPRDISLKGRYSWTLDPSAVTCPKCVKLLRRTHAE